MLSKSSIQAIPGVGEIIAAYTDWSPSDYASAIGAAFWAFALLLPMHNDRRDTLAAMTFAAVSLAFAVITMLAVPGKLKGFANFDAHLSFCLAIFVVGVARWYLRRTKLSPPTEVGLEAMDKNKPNNTGE